MRFEQTRMFAEAAEAPRIVAAQLRENRDVVRAVADRLRSRTPTAALICARGSSDHAGVYGRYLIESRTGVLVSHAALAVSSVYGRTPNAAGAVCFAISQSGRSPDLLAAAAAARRGGAFVIALVNAEGSPLAEAADLTIPLGAGPETSVAATKSFIASLTALAHVIAAWTGDDVLLAGLEGLPDQLAQAWRQDWRAALPVLEAASSLYVVGRGAGYGVAREAALKLKETCALHAEAFSAAEVRHGPMALVTADFPVLMLAQSDETQADSAALARDFAGRGAAVMAAGMETFPPVLSLPFAPGHPALEPILLIQSFYRLAAELSVARGLDPDRPPFLRKVTETV